MTDPSIALAGLTPLDALRIATACRHEAYRLRRRITEGRVPDQHVPATEDRIISLVLGEQALTHFAGLPPLSSPFISIGDAAARVVARMPQPAEACAE